MKKLYVPYLFDESSHAIVREVCKLFPEGLEGYFNREVALERARTMAMSNPKGKVVLLESVILIEPRKVEFVEKIYNEHGELIT